MRKIAIAVALAWGLVMLYVVSFGTALLPQEIYIGTPELHATVLAQPHLTNYQLVPFARVALTENWRVLDIMQVLEQAGFGKGNSICLISFHPYFDIGAFKHTFFTRHGGIELPSTDPIYICNQLDRCDAMIFKDGGGELEGNQPFIFTAVKPMYSCFESQRDALFNHAQDFSLPDGSTARLYFRKGKP